MHRQLLVLKLQSLVAYIAASWQWMGAGWNPSKLTRKVQQKSLENLMLFGYPSMAGAQLMAEAWLGALE